MKIKLLDANFNKDTHISNAVIQTKEGVFSASVKTLPCDYDIENRYIGCEFAERKATIKAMKARKQKLKVKIDAYNSLLKDLTELELTEDISFTIVNAYLTRTTKEYANLNNEIKAVSNRLSEDILNQREKIENINKKRKHKVKWVDLGEINLSSKDKN